MAFAQEFISDYEIPSVPIVDFNNRLVGAIEADDVIERLEDIEEAFVEQAVVKATRKPYFETSTWEMFKSRVTWIILLIVIGSLTQIIIIGFQMIWSTTDYWTKSDSYGAVTMSTLVTLAFTTAISMSSSINDSAGNTGAQTTTTLVRAIALDEITEGNYKKAIVKETTIGVYLGFVAGITAFARVFLVWSLFGMLNGINLETFIWLLLIASISSFSFCVSIIIGNFLGAILPIISDKRNWDGTSLSGPVQTTMVDIITFTLYLGITTAIFVPLSYAGIFSSAETVAQIIMT